MRRSQSRWLGRRYLVQIGTLRIASYAALLYLGTVAGITAGARYAAAAGVNPQRFALTAIVLLIPAFLGARLWYVAQNAAFFRHRISQIIRPLESGAAQDGGLILSLLFSIPILRLAAIPFGRFWDAAAITLLVGTIITRFGCLMNGCCSGRPTRCGLGLPLPNHRGEWRKRFPTPMFEAGLSLVILLGILASHKMPVPAGARFAACLVAYGFGRPLIALTRETDDFSRMMRISLGVSALLLLAAFAIVVCVR